MTGGHLIENPPKIDSLCQEQQYMAYNIYGTSTGRKPVKGRCRRATALVALLLGVPAWTETTRAGQFYQRTGKPASAGITITDPPEARSPFVLKAINDKSGLSAFGYESSEAPLVIRARPGNNILITYMNRMDEQVREPCPVGPCMNMTNLHFHGLHVSPQKGQDDVITMAALPGETVHLGNLISSQNQSLSSKTRNTLRRGYKRYVRAKQNTFKFPGHSASSEGWHVQWEVSPTGARVGTP